MEVDGCQYRGVDRNQTDSKIWDGVFGIRTDSQPPVC